MLNKSSSTLVNQRSERPPPKFHLKVPGDICRSSGSLTNGGGYKSEDLGETLCGLIFGVHLSPASETHRHLSGWSESRVFSRSGLRASNGGDFARALKPQIYVPPHSFKRNAATLTPAGCYAAPERKANVFCDDLSRA